MAYELFCKSVRGSSHIRKGTPCEDYGIKNDSGEYRIFAVADGHGDPNCLRSNIGSEYICRIASEDLSEFADSIQKEGLEEELFDGQKAKQRIEHLIRSIVSRWLQEVGEELKDNPLTDEEIKQAPVYAKDYKAGKRTERMYGTTLIAGLQTEGYLLLLQQGDGRCDVFDCNGKVSQPIPWDDRCVGTATTSLCDVDAAESCRYHIINLKENPIIACIVGTDGVEDSFPTSMEKTHAYYRNLLRDACEHGVQKMEESLSDKLNELSSSGSADDITVSGIIDVERVKPFLAEFEEINQMADIEDEVAILKEKVRSIEEGGRYQHLKEKYEEAIAAYEKAEKKYKPLSDECDKSKKEIDAYKQGNLWLEYDDGTGWKKIKCNKLIPSIISLINPEYKDKCKERDVAENELRIAEKKKKAAEAEYLPCQERYEGFKKKRDDAIKRLNELKG